jgi:hypothetical protein
MVARLAGIIAILLAAGSALAEPMNGEAARRFVAGKLFAFNCFDGSRGLGRIYADGSVIGSIQVQGSGPMRSVWLPPGTLHVKGEAVCATLKGMSFEPCFNVMRTSEQSFRGSLSGLGPIAYCDFVRRQTVAGIPLRTRMSSAPILLDPPAGIAQSLARESKESEQ